MNLVQKAMFTFILLPLTAQAQEAPRIFRILVAPMPQCATPDVFPPDRHKVIQVWNKTALDRAAGIHWSDETSMPWSQVAGQVALRKPDAIIGEYQFLLATIGTNYVPFLTWTDPVIPAVTGATLLTTRQTGIKSMADLKGKIIGVIDLAYPLGGGAQNGLLRSAGLGPDETLVRALGSTREVVHHLFAGTIDAAGLPEGEAEKVLREYGLDNAIPELRVISRFEAPSRYALFVRMDLLRPLPIFPGFLEKVLSEISPPGSVVREKIPAEWMVQPSLPTTRRQ